MKRKLVWTERGRRDLLAIGRFIARDDPSAARAWVEKLRQRAQAASNLPFAGRVVPEFGRDDTREAIVGNYRIVYLVTPNRIEVPTVFEGHQELPATGDPFLSLIETCWLNRINAFAYLVAWRNLCPRVTICAQDENGCHAEAPSLTIRKIAGATAGQWPLPAETLSFARVLESITYRHFTSPVGSACAAITRQSPRRWPAAH
ncbi:MAG: type II toxin-antitoxin system RelE/ParE family toxin [Candidatus Riflebacteria bacterium]|nr:type II toxin-antitoxin system RelE/ParE family toxin [Candidatus Riflebacteria bacterium]